MRGRSGESSDAAVRVISGPGRSGAPGGGAVFGKFELVAALPPTSPEIFEPFLGFGRGGFVEVGRKKSGGAKDDGFAVLGRESVEFFGGKALREEAHGKAVGGEAHGGGKEFPEGLRKAVE